MGQLRFLAAAVVGVADHAARALAREGSGLVVANGAGWARIYHALVDVATTVLDSGLAGETALAKTGGGVVQKHAVSVWSTGQIFAWIWLNINKIERIRSTSYVEIKV